MKLDIISSDLLNLHGKKAFKMKAERDINVKLTTFIKAKRQIEYKTTWQIYLYEGCSIINRTESLVASFSVGI